MDFRSQKGLYNQDTKSEIKGKDLFDINIFQTKSGLEVFYKFMNELKDTVARAEATETHLFLKEMSTRQKLTRVYTQNIDDLDKRVGLTVGFDKKSKVIQLHGDMETVKCTICSYLGEFTVGLFDTKERVNCPKCFDNLQKRLEQQKRPIAIGFLRPNIVLYNEFHSKGKEINEIVDFDFKKKQDILVVMGTSLKIIGVKQIIKRFHADMKKMNPKSLIIYINKQRSPAEYQSFFDYQLIGTSDSICRLLLNGINKKEKVEKEKKESKERKIKEESKQGNIRKHFKNVKIKVENDTKKELSENKAQDRERIGKMFN